MPDIELVDPTPTDPAPVDPAPVDPAPTDPAPSPADPAPVDSAAAPVDPAPTADPAEVESLRGEVTAEKDRADAAEQRATDAEQKLAEVLQSLGKLGGFVTDEAKTADPAETLAAITAESAAKDQTIRDLTIRDAVRTAAPGLGADADALADSASFQSAVGQLDPEAADFADRVATQITAALTANPRVKAAPSIPDRSGGDSGKTTEPLEQLTDEQFARLSAKDRLKAFAEGRYKA